ncbi:MAG: heme biosynthesis protein HemY [Hyphomicrobiales bacterium]|nr:heme biosynthesis protein HemY [Hyphomicrobiales bacterium]
MIRLVGFLIILAAAAFGFSWLADRPGEVTLVWQGKEISASLMASLGALIVLIVAVMVIWAILRFIFRIPTIMSLMARARRTNKGYAAVSKGMVAAAIGDARATERAAREATKHLGNVPLANLLQAQAAQIAGNRDKAITTFNQMLEDPETRVLGLRGLYLEAKRNGDSAAAHVFAKEAYGLAPLPWAGQALLEHHAMADDWAGALTVVESSIARKAVDKTTGNRQRGVLKTGIAMSIAGREPDEALRVAREAIKLAPDLIPAYVTAGRLLARRGDIRRAGRILEDGWRVKPHPDIARAYMDLRPGDSAADRLARARTLTKVYSDQPEARLTLARAALEARDFDLARKTMDALVTSEGSRLTVRACLLMADLEETEYGVTGRVREWLGRATRAARDPMWIADGVVSDTWAPASPVTGKLDAFVWDVPVERLSAPLQPEPEDKPDVLAPVIPPPKEEAGQTPSPAKSAAAAAAAATIETAAAAKQPVPSGKIIDATAVAEEADKQDAKTADAGAMSGKTAAAAPATDNAQAKESAASKPADTKPADSKAAETKSAGELAKAKDSPVAGTSPAGSAAPEDKTKTASPAAAKSDTAPKANAGKDAAKDAASDNGKNTANVTTKDTVKTAGNGKPAGASSPLASGGQPDEPAPTKQEAAAKSKIPMGPPDDPGPRKPA